MRGEDGTFYVLEDNLRVPSGVSYLLENRMVTKHVFPELFRSYSIEPVDPYIGRLGELLSSLSPTAREPTDRRSHARASTTPAYFEHAFLAQQLGVELVEGSDLVVLDDDIVHMRTVGGLERVDVIYRRIDDVFLDPEAFRRDSLVGVPGLIRAWRAGRWPWSMRREPGSPTTRPSTPSCPRSSGSSWARSPSCPTCPPGGAAIRRIAASSLANLDALVVKPANESGGYGIVIGPTAGLRRWPSWPRRIEQHPPNWVAQPVLSLSTMPTLCDGVVCPRHVDLRPFTLLGPDGAYVTPGGLTRVAAARRDP